MKISRIPLAAGAFAACLGTNAVFDGQGGSGFPVLRPASAQYTSNWFLEGFFHTLGHAIGIGEAAAAFAPSCPDDYGGPLSISDLVPSAGSVSETDLGVIFCGSGFTYGTQVSLSRQDAQGNTLTLIPKSMSWTRSNQMDAIFDLSQAATGFWDAGAYDAVENKTASLPRGFFVWGDALDTIGVSRITPRTGWNTGYTRLQIRGLGFDPDATVQLIRPGAAAPVSGRIRDNSNSSIVADFDLHRMEVGAWDVVVTNPDDGASSTLPGGFTVEAGARPMVRVSMVGPEIARLGNFTSYDIQLYNTGVVDARGLIVIHGIPADAEWRLTGQPNPLFERPGSYQLLDMPDGKTVILILPTTVIRSKQEINFGIEIRVPILPGVTERNYRINVIWDQFLS